MLLKPFHAHNRIRFYFVSPETCLHHLRTGCAEEFDYFFVFNDWYIPDHPSGLEAYRRLVEMDHSRLRIMCNSDRERLFLISQLGFSDKSTIFCSLHFSHGLTRATNMFTPCIGAERKYRAVMNARSADYKNRWAAAAVDGLACIDLNAGPSELACDYSNSSRLELGEVAAVMRQAYVGLSLSFIEGACLASLEYLLCGLPVVSTHSLGGRDAWYGEDNCILVGPSVEAALRGDFDRQALRREVGDAVDDWIARIEYGAVDAHAIRESALAVNEKFFSTFVAAIDEIITQDSEHDSSKATDPVLGELKPYYAYGAYLV